MFSHLASFLASLLPALMAIKVAKDRRGSCNWSWDKAKSQAWISILVIALSQIVIFTPTQPFSPLALLSLVAEIFGVYRLSRAIYRKKDLAKPSSPSRTTKLSGWQRIGILASLGWILGAGYYTFATISEANSRFHAELALRCEENLSNGMTESERTKWQEHCDSYLPTGERLDQEVRDERLEAFCVAFIPVPLGWSFVYLILFLVRWVKRGFVRPETPA